VHDHQRPWHLCVASVLLVVLSACDRGATPLQLAGPSMGTTYSVTVTQLPAGVGRDTIETAIEAVLHEADQHLSGWNDASELARFNAVDSADWVPVSPVLLMAVEEARRVSERSGEAFDVTVGPLVRAWGFGAGAADEPPAPAAEVIERLLSQVGYQKLELRTSPPALRKTVAGVSIDLDGIAPGWALDRLAERFEALGITDYLVEIGGEVRARGQSPDRRGWRVAVERPQAGARLAQVVIELGDAGVSTSGDYRDYREINGRRISHTIDPRTGQPVAHDLASVTVVHASVAAADAWATALMVLGPEEGMALARREGLAALFIERGGQAGEFVETETPHFARLRRPLRTGL
jgi:thiamine biosynthesis lipoprotein